MAMPEQLQSAMQILMHHTQQLALALLPPTCSLCRQNHAQPTPICHDCINGLPRNEHACCRCAEPSHHLDERGSCYRCRVKSPVFVSVTAPFLMTGPVQQLIHQWKFEGHTTLSPVLAALLAKHLIRLQKVEADTLKVNTLLGLANHHAVPQARPSSATSLGTEDPGYAAEDLPHASAAADSAAQSSPVAAEHLIPKYLVPIPSHWRRRWHRGFDQTWLLANNLTRLCGIPVVQGLRRTRFATAQHQLSRYERTANMQDAFAAQIRLTGGHIALIDDVVTTGATATAATQALLAAGADSVEVWCLARTPAPARS